MLAPAVRTFQLLRRLRPVCLSALAFWGTLASAQPAAALDYLAAEPMTKKVRIDGMLTDWPGGFAKLNVTLSGKGKPVEALIGYDATKLYVAAKVEDAKIVRTKNGGKGEDRLLVDVWVPREGGGGATHTIAIFPGDPGKLPGLVQVDGSAVAAAKAVEAPTAGGYVLEAEIPWSALPDASAMRVGLRARLSYSDASSVGSVSSLVSTSKLGGEQMPPLTLECETGLFQSLLETKGLSSRPARQVYGNVWGKSEPERVALYGRFLSIVGSAYKGGKEFYFSDLDVNSADDVRRLQLVDFSGDGLSEIVLEKRIGDSDKYRQVLEVLTVGADGTPRVVFQAETAIVTPDGFVDNAVKITGSGKAARIVVSQDKEKGFEPDTFREPTIGGGIPSAILPWESVRSKSYGWKGDAIAELEITQGTARRTSKAAAVASAPAVAAPPPPRPPTADEMLDRVYALYKKDRGVGAKKARFDFVTDVVEDTTPERVLVHGQDLIVFGKGFKKGLSYTFLTMGVKSEEDVLSVTTHDLEGDGKAEIVVHAVLRAKASKELGGDEVTRQALFVYKVLGESLTRIFAAETARSVGKDRVVGGVVFEPGARGVEITLRPLTAVGWSEKSYPFPEDRHPAGGLEPLLLPWGTVGPRTYRFDGSSYALLP